ncbi:MAG: TetR/AcrR family transcriptional regulator [Flavobacteriaceae bacterium]|nr:TetR/AcrR family transcriptional regulator [Flavobacteriaceae bacterium]
MAKRVKSPEKRAALLEATLHLVNNNGFHNAPMSKIAKMADVSPATIYIYFENKQDLINQLYIEVKKSLSSYAFNNYSEDLSVEKGFELIWYNIANFKLNQIEAAQFLSQCDNTPLIDDASREEGIKHLQPLVTLWERGQKEGIIKPISPYILYAFTIYPLSFLIINQQLKFCKLDTDKLNDAYNAAWDSIKQPH